MASPEDFGLPEDPRELRGTCVALPSVTSLEAYETALTDPNTMQLAELVDI